MELPKYLKNISEQSLNFKTRASAKLKCKCNSEIFNIFISEEKRNIDIPIGFNEIVRENDKLYYIKRNFLGLITKKIECTHDFKKRRIVFKAVCEACGEEYLIYDNYQFGYEAVINKKIDIKSWKMLNYKKLRRNASGVLIKIQNDIKFDEFKDEFCDLSYDDYLLAFTCIDIYAVLNDKKIKLYSEEIA